MDDLTYHYDGALSRDSVQRAVEQARDTLVPVAKFPNFLPILTERFARDQLLAAATAEGKIATTVPEILFVCVHNAGRSQMAAGLAKHLTDDVVHAADVIITMAAVTPARSSPASDPSTGTPKTPPARASTPCAPSATRSRPASRPYWQSSSPTRAPLRQPTGNPSSSLTAIRSTQKEIDHECI